MMMDVDGMQDRQPDDRCSSRSVRSARQQRPQPPPLPHPLQPSFSRGPRHKGSQHKLRSRGQALVWEKGRSSRNVVGAKSGCLPNLRA